jgi:hypothetical protein
LREEIWRERRKKTRLRERNIERGKKEEEEMTGRKEGSIGKERVKK